MFLYLVVNKWESPLGWRMFNRKAYYAKNPEKWKSYYARKQKEWREANRERYSVQRKRSYEKHREMILLRKRERIRALVKEAIEHYGGKCACCNEAILWFLSLDHINGLPYGTSRKGRVGGHTFYAKLKRAGWPEGFQVLCYNCNCAKGFFGACPHKGPPPFIRRKRANV